MNKLMIRVVNLTMHLLVYKKIKEEKFKRTKRFEA